MSRSTFRPHGPVTFWSSGRLKYPHSEDCPMINQKHVPVCGSNSLAYQVQLDQGQKNLTTSTGSEDFSCLPSFRKSSRWAFKSNCCIRVIILSQNKVSCLLLPKCVYHMGCKLIIACRLSSWDLVWYTKSSGMLMSCCSSCRRSTDIIPGNKIPKIQIDSVRSV